MGDKPSKSDRTRGVILEAAQRLFAAHGYDGTTIRGVATESGIDPALVIRYFGSKEELFIRTTAVALGVPALEVLEQPLIGEILVRHFLGLWEGAGAAQGMAVLLRSAASNELSAAKLREVFTEQLVPLFEHVGPRSTAAHRSALVGSQLLGLAFCRYVLKLPPLAEMSIEELARQVGPGILRYVMLKPEPARPQPQPSVEQTSFGFLSGQEKR